MSQAAGARGVKVLKTLGLYLRDGGPTGKLVAIDDARFDPMWEACGRLGLPVAIHIADPEAFFCRPIGSTNGTRSWRITPTGHSTRRASRAHRDLLAACDRVFAKHPKTTFLALHVGHVAENLALVGERLDRRPNMCVELRARIGELGRQPRTARRFFESIRIDPVRD